MDQWIVSGLMTCSDNVSLNSAGILLISAYGKVIYSVQKACLQQMNVKMIKISRYYQDMC